MVGHGTFLVQFVFHKGADPLFLIPQAFRQRYIEDQIHVPAALDHAKIVKAQPLVPLPQQGFGFCPQPLKLRVVGDHGVIVDHQMDVVAAQTFPLHIVDDLVAFHGVFPMVHLHMEAGVALAGAVIVDHQIVIAQDLGVTADVVHQFFPQFGIGAFAQQRGYGFPGHLDAAVEKYGKTLEAAAAALVEYNKGLIDALCDIVPAVKPQAAYYEMYGWQGVKALTETIAYAQEKGMFVITDGKRNDIGATMEAYATAHMGTTDVFGEKIEAFGADGLTVNGYLGTDGIKPLLNVCNEKDTGIFVLVKTSNPSSGELQDQKMESGKSVYETMGEFCENWGEAVMGKYGYSGVGAVVGATYPAQLGEMREKAPHTFFLVPGYGAQGGAADDVAPAFDKNGLGAIVNSSRGIMCAWQKEKCDEHDYAQAARREAIRMRDEIVARIGEIKL